MNHNLLENFTAVEISTVIVEEIVEEMFISWEVYQGIFALSRFSLEQSAIDRSLFDRYLQLRRQLELAYCLLLVDPSSQLYNRTEAAEIRRDLPVLSQPNDRWEAIPTRLPEPIPSDRGAEPSAHRHQTMSQVNELLQQPQFVNVLQQLNKHKVALDRRDRTLRSSSCQNNITDTAYAQTSLQLDGKIINRYSQAILERSDRDLLLRLHKQSTTTGEQQWRGLIKFMLSLLAK